MNRGIIGALALHKKSVKAFAQRTNLIAGGSATGSESLVIRPWKGRISIPYSSTLSGSAQDCHTLSVGVAHGYSIQPLRGLLRKDRITSISFSAPE
jgi:hypothetical protein